MSVQLSLLVLEPAPIEHRRHIHGFPQRRGNRTHLLPPFAPYAAFPRSDYYGGSAPHPRRRWTWQLAEFRIPGARIEVPVFTGGTLGSVGGRLYPWQRGLLADSGQGGSVAMSATPSEQIATHQALAAISSRRRGGDPYRELQHRLHRSRQSPGSVHHGTFGSPPRTEASLRALKAARLLQAAVPISATFAAPFCIRPDPDEDDVLLGHRFLLAPHGAHEGGTEAPSRG